ncbi:hypothetical protein [Paenibacillus sp. SI8]|uniref:hypothetical protein n=1 Tax=unclassified Paenibacillus TaxID=185978 RepID=UPI003465F4E6
MFISMLNGSGLSSGVVYASGVLKASEVMKMAADFRAQETITEMTQRVLRENGLSVNEEIAIAANDDYLGFNAFDKNVAFSIPLMSQQNKGEMVNA